jgi:pyrophosphatase PpaX
VRSDRAAAEPPIPSPWTPRWETVFFDLDGTLADTIPLIVASYQHAFREVMGVEVGEEAARAWIGRPLLDALLEVAPDHGHELDRVYREWNLSNTERLIRSYPGIPDLLTDLASAGARAAVVTSKRRETALLALQHVGIADRIDVVAALEDTARHKPDPDPLEHGATVLGADPVSCVYVGDATVDLLAARAAGMACVAVTWGAGTRAELLALAPDGICDTVEELGDTLLPGRL